METGDRESAPTFINSGVQSKDRYALLAIFCAPIPWVKDLKCDYKSIS